MLADLRIAACFGVPPLMVGNAPEPRCPEEHGDYLLAMCEAGGFDPYELGGEIADAAVRRHLRMIDFYGVTKTP